VTRPFRTLSRPRPGGAGSTGCAPPAALASLKQRFLIRCAADLQQLLDYAAGHGPSRDGLAFVVHRLAGAAGTFGYGGVSIAAARLDADLAAPGRPPPSLEPLINELNAMLDAEAAQPPLSAPTPSGANR